MTAPSLRIAISPQSFEIRILQVITYLNDVGGAIAGPNNVAYTSSARYTPDITRYTGTASSGTSVTPETLRDGAPTCSSLARTGTTVSISGTASIVTVLSQTYAISQARDEKLFTPPSDMTMQPGGVLVIQTGTINTFGQSGLDVSGKPGLTVYFEELRLSWPY